MLRETLLKIVAKKDLSRQEAEEAMEVVLSGRATNAQIVNLLRGLRAKTETLDEIVGFANAMRRHATPIFPSNHPIADTALVDTCGTGGDGSGTFNISTVAAFVVAGAGVRVAKHGNRSVSSRCGSADVLEQLGARIDLPPDSVARCIESAGIGFVFAPAVHAATRYAVAARRELKTRTIFNLLGPLTNPARASAQVVGVYDKGVIEPMARALGELGVRRAFVVCGDDGLDEISISALPMLPSCGMAEYVALPSPPQISDCAAPLSKRFAAVTQTKRGDRSQNSRPLDALSGPWTAPRDRARQRGSGAGRRRPGENFLEGVRIATHSIDSGAARERLDAFIAFSQIEAKPIFS